MQILADIQYIISSFSFFELVYVSRKAHCCAKETYTALQETVLLSSGF
jgi:hypothetical protein